jgi:hypothetical protein
MLKLSCCVYKGYEVACILKDGNCVSKSVRRAKKGKDRFSDSLDLFNNAFNLLKLWIEQNTEEDSVIIETKNKTIIKWFTQGYSTDKYNDKFYEVMYRLNLIPIEYSFIYNENTISTKYAKEGYLDKEKIENMESSDVEDTSSESDLEELAFTESSSEKQKLSGVEDFM